MALLALGLAHAATGVVAANTITPSTFVDEHGHDPDNGNCTLREAVISAETDTSKDACRRGNGPDVIKLRRGRYELSVPGTGTPGSVDIDAHNGDLDIGGSVPSGPLKVVAPRRGATVDANGHDRVFHVFGQRVTFIRLTITGGNGQDLGGGGVAVGNAGEARFLQTDIAGNSAADDGGGLLVDPGSEASFEDGSVRTNEAGTSGIGVGGGIAASGPLKLKGTHLRNNDAKQAGGIFTRSVARLVRSKVNGNSATDQSSGGIGTTTGSRLIVKRSSIKRNFADTWGGGIYLNESALVMRSSTLSGNRANEQGGGLATGAAPSDPVSVRITNSTISGNVADADEAGNPGEGGGLALGAVGSKRIVSSTITRNRAQRGGGLVGPFVASNGAPVLKGTIVAGNSATLDHPANGPDCWTLASDPAVSLGHNLIGTLQTCNIDRRGSDITGRNPRLRQLGRYGGPTPTHALRRRSPAVNNGPRDAPRRDQRGVRRVNPDIGAFERR